MIFLALLDDRTSAGVVSLSFSPCYNCFPVYLAQFVIGPTGSIGVLFVNGIEVANTANSFAYTLGSNKAVKFLVQTIPQKKGIIRIKAQYVRDNGSKQEIFDSTIVPVPHFAPFGITYAVFGNDFTNNAATYSFNDGNNILLIIM